MSENSIPFPSFIVRQGSRTLDLAPYAKSMVLTAGMSEVTEIAVEIEDPYLRILNSGIFVVGNAIADYGNHRLSLSAKEATGGTSGMGGLRLQFRSRFVRNMKRRRGPHVLRSLSATEYIKSECKAMGIQFVIAQNTSKRTQIARDIPKDAEPPPQGAAYPSAFTTFQRLAQEEGFLFFEYLGAVYFGRPSWLLNRRKEDAKVAWLWTPSDESILALEHPIARMSEDADTLVEISMRLPYARRQEIRPGWSLRLQGFPDFGNRYIVNRLSYSLGHDGGINVDVTSAIDPIPSLAGGTGGTTDRGVGKYKNVADAAIKAGFKGQPLIIAIAVAIAESGGNARAISPPNTGGRAAGSRDYGLWQINEFYHQFDKSLILGADYNAQFAYRISTRGTNWNPWTTYRNGAYRQFLDEARSSVETTQGITTSARGSANVGSSSMPSYSIESPSSRGWGGPGLSIDGKGARAPWTRVYSPQRGGGVFVLRREAAPLFRELLRLLLLSGAPHLTSSGGYNYRTIANSNRWSNHAWGLAVDIDAVHNPYSRVFRTDLPANTRKIANSLGMRWGGDYRVTKDTMHFELMLSYNDALALIRSKGLR